MDDTSKVFPPQPPADPPPPPIMFVSKAEPQRPTHYAAAASVSVPPQERLLASGASPAMKKPKPSKLKRRDQSRHKPRSRRRS